MYNSKQEKTNKNNTAMEGTGWWVKGVSERLALLSFIAIIFCACFADEAASQTPPPDMRLRSDAAERGASTLEHTFPFLW